jgi:hypothetical protein
MIARIADGATATVSLVAAQKRRLGEAHKLLDELSNMLTEMRRELLGGRRR